MTRVLQVRRGTTTQNNNFTGLSGELSFDTTAKTLRVHDGETLGGFALVRADQVSGGSESSFDINSVPASFWQSIIATYVPSAIQTYESDLCTISTGSYLEYIFDLQKSAKFAQAVLVCQTPEAGYSIDDVVAAFGINTRTNPLPNTFTDESGLHTRLFMAYKNFWVSHKTSGAQTTITNSKWKLKFVIWY